MIDDFKAASAKALAWCQRNPKWKRICDIVDSNSMTLSWFEIPSSHRKVWIERHGDSAEDCWREFSSNHPQRHRYGFIGSNGVFYDHILDLPRCMNSMMVFEIGGKPGVYYQGGMRARSSRAKVEDAEATSMSP
jgi:hypothetical protein